MSHVKRFRCAAFTLVELLVVIGIIAVLLAILLPALSRAHEHANQIVCLNNEKQIAAAIIEYVNDNRGKLPLLIAPLFNQTPFEAICMTAPGSLDYDNGVLWPYVGPNPAIRQNIFNCPSDPDPKVADPAGTTAGAPTPPRNFSYGLTFELDKCSVGAPLMGGSTEFGLKGIYAMPYPMVRRPDHKLMVIEEYSPAAICDGEDVYIITAPGTISELTSRHSGRANIAFFDGHCEPFDPATFSGITDNNERVSVYLYWVDVWY